jgi:glucose-6-phosphate 1-dehydrogenase
LPLDDNAPAIDGAYIFPNPTEQSSDDGFYRFRVSGYGRTSTVGTYAPLNAAQASVEVDREERWITYSQEEYLVQNVCLIRSSPLQKISVAVPGRAKRTGNSFTRRIRQTDPTIGFSSSNFMRFYETFIWQVVSTDVNYFGRVEETRIIWRYARTYLNDYNSFLDGKKYTGTALI